MWPYPAYHGRATAAACSAQFCTQLECGQGLQVLPGWQQHSNAVAAGLYVQRLPTAPQLLYQLLFGRIL